MLALKLHIIDNPFFTFLLNNQNLYSTRLNLNLHIINLHIIKFKENTTS